MTHLRDLYQRGEHKFNGGAIRPRRRMLSSRLLLGYHVVNVKSCSLRCVNMCRDLPVSALVLAIEKLSDHPLLAEFWDLAVA